MEEDYWLVLHEGTPLESAAQWRILVDLPTLSLQGLRNVQWKAYRRSSGEELLRGGLKVSIRWLTKRREKVTKKWMEKGWCHFDSYGILWGFQKNRHQTRKLRHGSFSFGLVDVLRCRVPRQIPMSGSRSCGWLKET